MASDDNANVTGQCTSNGYGNTRYVLADLISRFKLKSSTGLFMLNLTYKAV